MSWASWTAGSASAIARVRARRSRPSRSGSTWTTTSASGRAPRTAGLDPVGGPVAGDQRLVGCGADRRVGEVMAAGLAQAQLAQLDVVEGADRRFGLGLGLGGRGVHQHPCVLVDQARGGAEDDRGDDQRGDRVALLEAERDGGDADRGRRPSPPCRRRSGRRSSAAPRTCTPWRCGGRRSTRLMSTARASADDREDVPARVEAGAPPRAEPVDRLDHDEGATAGEDRRLAERREVLGPPVPIGVLAVGGAPAEADRRQRQDRGDDIAARLDPGRDQGEGRSRSRCRASARPGRRRRRSRPGRSGSGRGGWRRSRGAYGGASDADDPVGFVFDLAVGEAEGQRPAAMWSWSRTGPWPARRGCGGR